MNHLLRRGLPHLALIVTLAMASQGCRILTCGMCGEPDYAAERAKEDEILHAAQRLEAADPDAAAVRSAFDAGRPLPPDEAMARLEKSCAAGNRVSCLAHGLNTLQRTGDRHELFAATHAILEKYGMNDEWVQHFALKIGICLGDTVERPTGPAGWIPCQDVKARFLTNFRWTAVSGADLSALFPSGDPPPAFPKDALAAVPPGRGWVCFPYHQVLERFVAGDDRQGVARGQEVYNTGISERQCFRTAVQCEAARSVFPTTRDTSADGRCEPYDGILYVLELHRQDGPVRQMFWDTDSCGKIARQFSWAKPSACAAVGDVPLPGM